MDFVEFDVNAGGDQEKHDGQISNDVHCGWLERFDDFFVSTCNSERA
jgi:hypothetical protein